MIRITPIRLVGPDNEQIGVVETSEALRMADEAGMDLVEISPDARPPVCRIMDYGKFKYEQSKEDKSKTKNKGSEIKEVRLGRSIKIDPHDVSIRVDQARRFLLEGHKVMIVQVYRGREMMHQQLGEQTLRGIVDDLSDVAKVEVPPRFAGRRVSLIMAPDKVKIEAIKRKEAKEAAAAAKAAAKPSAEAKPATAAPAAAPEASPAEANQQA